MSSDTSQKVYLVQGIQDSLKKARVNRQMRDGQKTPPAKAESEIDSGLLGRAGWDGRPYRSSSNS